MKAGSLKLRLLAAAAVSIALALFLAGLLISALFENQVKARVLRELNTHLLQLAGLLEVDDAGTLRLDGRMADPRFGQAESGLYWQLDPPAPTVPLLSRSLWDTRIAVPLGTGETGAAQGLEGEPLLYASRRVTLTAAGKPFPVTITIAMLRAETDAAVASFRWSLFWSLSALAAALTLAAWAQVRVGLSPLAELRRGLAAIRGGGVSRLEGEYPDEVAPLVGEFNGVLAQQAKSLERARSRASDLAHGLKTPLTVLSVVSREIARAGMAEAAAEIEDQIGAMRRHTDRQLARARLAAGAPVSPARLDEAAGKVLQAMRRSPRGDDLAWELSIPAAAAVRMEPQDLLELLGNLLDNARKWATSRVAVSFDPATGVLTIADDGPGVPEADLTRIGARGTRLDERVQGTGLGLAIVADIAELYGLSLAYARAKQGGLAVTVGFA